MNTTTAVNPLVIIADAIAIGRTHGVELPAHLALEATIAFIRDAVTEKARFYKDDIRTLGRLQRALEADPVEAQNLFEAPAANGMAAE